MGNTLSQSLYEWINNGILLCFLMEKVDSHFDVDLKNRVVLMRKPFQSNVNVITWQNETEVIFEFDS